MRVVQIVRGWVLAGLLGVALGLQGAAVELHPQDVAKVMDHIFEYHVDKKQMTPELLGRSLKLYIEQFDPDHLYLLASEVASYEHPSQALLDRMQQEYLKDQLDVYSELDQLIQTAIYRSRAIRKELYKQIYALVQSNETIQPDPVEPKPPFAANEAELKARTLKRLALFVEIQREKVGLAALKGKEERLVSLYERSVEGRENEYLNVDDNGQPLAMGERTNQLTLRVLKALAKSLDAHTAYFSPQEAYEMKVRLEKGFSGVGIVLQEGIEGITVTRLLDSGPAGRSGLIQVQDRIVEIDGVNVEKHSFESVLDMIRGKEGSILTLGLKRALPSGSDKLFSVQLRREQITMNESRVDVSQEPYQDGIIGKIVLHSFYEGENGISSEKDIRDALRDLYAKGNLKGLILDLRDNTGGFLMQAVKVAGLFITNGVVVVSKYANGEIRYFRDIDGQSYYDGPMIILTSQLSASAAEIVAQTLQDYGRAIIVGDEHTYGKGSIQHQTVTGNDADSFFKVTVGRYYTVSGQTTQMVGVRADVVVPTLFHGEKIGEKFLEYPLSRDSVSPAYQDNLSDVDAAAKRWYMKYYLPTMQKPSDTYRRLVPMLRERSAKRLGASQDFQKFLRMVDGKDAASLEERVSLQEGQEEKGYKDLPMEEAVNILKDMITLAPQTDRLGELFSGNSAP